MERKLIALKRILEELGVPADIDTVDDRKRIQKAIYLAQLPGIDLGYSFSWYVKGPYSPALTRDYYSLSEALSDRDSKGDETRLNATVRERLHSIIPLLGPP